MLSKHLYVWQRFEDYLALQQMNLRQHVLEDCRCLVLVA